MAEGKFRSDLYFRLRVLELQLPALRNRDADILLLARHFLDQHGQRYGKPGLFFSDKALATLASYAWPGNVRELRNAIEQTVLLANAREIRADQLPIGLTRAGDSRIAATVTADFELPDDGVDLKALEHSLLEQAMAKTGGNVTRAARLLGLTRDTLRYRLDKLQDRSSAG